MTLRVHEQVWDKIKDIPIEGLSIDFEPYGRHGKTALVRLARERAKGPKERKKLGYKHGRVW